jgi:hypothetical protein
MSQTGYIQGRAELGQLLYENFKQGVKPWFGLMDPLAALFDEIGPGEFESITGGKLVFARDTRRAGGAMGTSGWLPASQYVDPIRLETVPARMYVRRAIDNFIAAVASGKGSFEDYVGRINRQMWDAFEEMERRHVHGSSTGTVCEIAARTSATVITVKNGYGYPGQPPLGHLEAGMWVAVLDASNAFAVLGAAKIARIDTATNTITFATPIDNGTTMVAAGDPVVFSTTPNVSADYFETERGKAKLGLLDIIDPRAQNASYLTVNEADEPRVKPLRRQSTDFGELEFLKFIRELSAKSTSPVTPTTHTMSTQPGVVLELAQRLIATTQFNAPKGGKTLKGGWETVQIAGHDFIESPYHLWDVIYAHCMEDYHDVDLDGEPAVWAGDGSEFQRLSDYDGKEWFVKHYSQRFASRRNRLGALVGVPNPEATRYTDVP